MKLLFLEPPGPPVDAEAFVNKTTVTLTWSPPRDSTGRTDLSYRCVIIGVKVGNSFLHVNV